MKTEISVCESSLVEKSYCRGSDVKFAALFDKYQDFFELTPAMIHRLVETIVVHEREMKDSQTSPLRPV